MDNRRCEHMHMGGVADTSASTRHDAKLRAYAADRTVVHFIDKYVQVRDIQCKMQAASVLTVVPATKV